MNIAVGKVSSEARAAILEVGGSIEPTLKPTIVMVKLPDGTEMERADEHSVDIVLPSEPPTTLTFTRAWQTENCSLDLHKSEDTPHTTIKTQRRSDDWVAYVASERGKWKAGKTEVEAIGKLIVSHPGIFGAVQRDTK